MPTPIANPYDAADLAATSALHALGIPVARAERDAAQLATTLNFLTGEGFDDTDPFELYHLLRHRLPSASESAIRAAVIAWSSFNRQPVGDGTYR